jgi:hypothetical protein
VVERIGRAVRRRFVLLWVGVGGIMALRVCRTGSVLVNRLRAMSEHRRMFGPNVFGIFESRGHDGAIRRLSPLARPPSSATSQPTIIDYRGSISGSLDAEVIRDAASRQMAHVRTYQLGKYQALSQKILNELRAAKACLLDPRRKEAYDGRLRQRLTETETPRIAPA